MERDSEYDYEEETLSDSSMERHKKQRKGKENMHENDIDDEQEREQAVGG